MYETFFQFTEIPFNLTPDPRFFFFSKKHEEAFDHIRYGIQERKGFIVVTGEVGTGKTTLSRLLLEKLDKKIRTSMIFNPSLSTIELLQAINQDFGIPGDAASKKELVETLNRFLLQALAEGGNALLIIDEGQNLSIECLEEIRMLSNLETEKEKLLQILLIGQPELREKLQVRELRQLNQRIAIRYHIAPLDLEETKAYVAYRLKVAGGHDRLLFTPKALEKLYHCSGGVPRLINILCDKALLAAYARESRVVDDAAVARAATELEGPPTGNAEGRTVRPTAQRRRETEGRDRSKAPWFSPLGATIIGLLLTLLAGLVWGVPAWRAARKTIENSMQPEPSVASNALPVAATEETEPKPAPVAKPTETVVSPPRKDGAGRFDENGVFRAVRPEETHNAALLTLLKIWGNSASLPSGGFKDSDGDRFMSVNGFSAYRFPIDLKRIRILDYPCLIRGHWTHGTTLTDAVLVHLTDQDATILDPLNGKTTYDLDLLQTLWGEKGTVYFKRLPGIALPLKSKGTDSSVKTIQKALKVQGLYLGKADGVLGPNTKRAIRFFQQKYGLRDSSRFDFESYLVLSRVMFRETPGLQIGDL
ncbi:MAG: AAA family ATPase [Nitrospirae bacterium]|nr:AAA family ATPase [Nitrospirota bacterium]